MKKLKHLFENNERWVEKRLSLDPDFFTRTAKNQQPKYLWIGCSDSRIPANEVVDLAPGDLFVHRNIANLVPHTDMNSLSVIKYAVDILKIEHIIICGHYDCGGVNGAMENHKFGLVDNWLRHIADIYIQHKEELENIEDETLRKKRLVELNVLQQVKNVCHTTIVQSAWHRGQLLSVHGWVYDIKSGLLGDLDYCISSPTQVEQIYHVM